MDVKDEFTKTKKESSSVNRFYSKGGNENVAVFNNNIPQNIRAKHHFLNLFQMTILYSYCQITLITLIKFVH